MVCSHCSHCRVFVYWVLGGEGGEEELNMVRVGL